jgi:hypothetical protein
MGDTIAEEKEAEEAAQSREGIEELTQEDIDAVVEEEDNGEDA